MNESHLLGASAEELAAGFLESQGYCILHRNWTYGHKELDIVCTDGRLLVVVEVKARSGPIQYHPGELISSDKEKNLIDASEQYLFHHRVRLPVRFDLMAVTKRNGKLDIEHFKDAFMPRVE